MVWAVKTYAERNGAVHSDIDDYIENLHWSKLAMAIYTNLQDVDRVIPATLMHELPKWKETILYVRNQYFGVPIDLQDPDSWQPIGPKAKERIAKYKKHVAKLAERQKQAKKGREEEEADWPEIKKRCANAAAVQARLWLEDSQSRQRKFPSFPRRRQVGAAYSGFPAGDGSSISASPAPTPSTTRHPSPVTHLPSEDDFQAFPGNLREMRIRDQSAASEFSN